MGTQRLPCAENELSHFLWRARVHRFSRQEVCTGLEEVKAKIIGRCHKDKTACSLLDGLIANKGSEFDELLRNSAFYADSGLL